MRISALYFVLLSLVSSSLSEPDIEQSLANFRKALGNKLLAVDAVPRPPAVIISTPVKPVHTNLGIIQNYLGTESNNETAEAINIANSLVSSGILPGFKPSEGLSPLSESNPNYSGSKKPCHHKEDVTSNKDTVLKPFSDSNNNNSPVPQTAKPCRHKETSTQKPVSETETPLQPNKDSISDSTSVTKKPCHHKETSTLEPLSQTETPLQPNKESNFDSSTVTKKPCHHSSVQTITSTVALTSNNEKVDIVEQLPVSPPIPEAPQLPPWQPPVAGQVIVEETASIPDNQVTIVQPGLCISSSSHDCNKDKIEIVERPVWSPIPPAPLLPPWQIPVSGQIVIDETNYIPDNHVNIVQPGFSISSSSHDKVEIVERPVFSPIPPAPLLPPWQIPVSGQIVVDETSYIPDNHLNIVQPGLSICSSHYNCNKDKIEIIERPVLSPIPPAPLLPTWQVPAAGQVIVEETDYIPNRPCIHKNFSNKKPCVSRLPPFDPPVPVRVPAAPLVVDVPSSYTYQQVKGDGGVETTFALQDGVHTKFAPNPYIDINSFREYSLRPAVSEIRYPAEIAVTQPVIEPLPAPLVVDVPSSYTYQQVKGDGSVDTTFALQDGVHTKFAPNPYLDINGFREYPQRPAAIIPTDVKSYYDRVYPSVQSQYDQYPHIESGFNEYNVHNRPYEYNQYPVQHQIPQRPYNSYTSGHNNGPRPQVNNYQPGHHVHPQSFNHHQQPTYGGYSYKQIHGDGSITSYQGSNGNVQTLKNGSPQLTASKDIVQKPAPQVPYANNVVRQQQNFNAYPNQMTGNNNPMIAQESTNPMYFSYMFKQLGFNGARFDSGSKPMPSPAELPVVNTNVRRPESGLPSAANTVPVNPSTKNNIHVTSYSGFTNNNVKSPEANRESEIPATTTRTTSYTNKGMSEVKPGPGFKVAYGIGENTASKKSPIEYNPIIVLDATTSRSNYYYGQSNSDGSKTEFTGDRVKKVIQNADDSPKENERRKLRGDIPEAY